MMKKQHEIIAKLSDREIVINVYLTQAILLFIAFICGWFVFDSWAIFFQLFQLNVSIVWIGGGVAVFVVCIDLVTERLVPTHWLDDGGINKRVFRSLTTPQLVTLCLVVSVAEELLFRAVLQSAFGLVIASIAFALIHVRYLNQPILFINVCLVSFLLGAMFYLTGNILVTIFAHFLIDLLLGLVINRQFSGEENRNV